MEKKSAEWEKLCTKKAHWLWKKLNLRFTCPKCSNIIKILSRDDIQPTKCDFEILNTAQRCPHVA